MSSASHERRAVAIGGGTGMPAVLGCLLEAGFQTSAVVTMADDGGSSGKLRDELGMLPPGDARNCLVAMGDPDSLVAQLFQYRFPHGEGLAGHALGNLIIAALADITGGFPEAMVAAGELLEARGRVIPSTLEDVRLCATDRDGLPLEGQALIAASRGPFRHVDLDPACPPVYGPALDSIEAADVIVIGPGSLFTSILPNFLVDGVADAVRSSAARRIYVCNLANQRGETEGMNAYDHVLTLCDHGLCSAIDVVVVHDAQGEPRAAGRCLVCDDDASPVERVEAGEDVRRRITELGIEVVARDLIDVERPVRHSRALLCRVLREVTG